MKRLLHAIDRFFFEPISASGFGLMRIVWGTTVFFSMLSQWNQVDDYYTYNGLLTKDLLMTVARNYNRFSVFDWIVDPTAVWGVYILFLVLAASMVVGILPRFTTILTVLLYFSFHERQTMILAGGETVLRTLGYVLMIAPGIQAFSLARAELQWKSWVKNRTLLPPLKMSIWPYRLLLWQFLVIYISSAYDKILGATWWVDGTALAISLHHASFSRNLVYISALLSQFSVPLSRLVVIFEFSWLFLLIPRSIWRRLGFRAGGVKRALLFWGFIFHFSILSLMAVGTFPIAIFVGYIGLLKDEDFIAFRRLFNRFWKSRIVVLYDGGCGFCRRSMAWLNMSDWLQRLEFHDFRDAQVRKTLAADVTYKELDRALHVRFIRPKESPKKSKLENGFDAIRSLSWHLPVLWLFIPILFMPGVRPIGRRAYQFIADRRNRCEDEQCLIV